MKIQHYSLNGERPVSRIKELIRYKLPLLLYYPLSKSLCICHRFLHAPKQFKYKASLCLIFKDEAPYLKEWLEYHLLIGIDHFYLYNNNSSDNYLEVLGPYIEDGTVTLIQFPEKYAQVKAYRDCYEKTKNETEWLGYIDVDEYVNLIGHNSIGELLDTVAHYPSLYLNWRMFGTSGHLKENHSELTIERYTQAWRNLSSTGKGFINNNFPSHSVTVHFHTSRIYGLPVLGVLANKSLRHSLYYISSCGVDKVAYLNHYWSRSLEFYRYKDFQKGDATNATNESLRTAPGRFERHELRNSTKDFSIQRWLIFLKMKMK